MWVLAQLLFLYFKILTVEALVVLISPQWYQLDFFFSAFLFVFGDGIDIYSKLLHPYKKKNSETVFIFQLSVSLFSIETGHH